jgi:hypothetical protein
MNEDKMRELIQGSLLKTSDEFTDKLMNKVEFQIIAKKMRVAFFSALLACVVLLFSIYQLANLTRFLDLKVNITPLSIWALGSLTVFILLNRLMNIKVISLKAQ